MARGGRSEWAQASLPKFAFVLLMLAGIAFIWSAKTHQWLTAYTLIVPVALMGVYFLLSAVLAGFRLHDEQAGDNLYYMGFLFTLTSLGVSLYRFSAEASIDTIVRDFGLAVATTICGIGLRILYNQVRRDPIDIERAARHELAEMTRRVRVELEAASREFANFRRVSNQMLEEGFEEIGRHAERSGQQIMKVMESLTQDAVTPIRSAGEAVIAVVADVGAKTQNSLANAAERMETATASFESANGRMAETVTGFAAHLDTVGAKLSAIQTPDEVVSVKLRPVLATLEKLIAAQTARLEASDTLHQVQTTTLEKTLQAMDALGVALQKSVAALDQTADLAARSQQSTENLARSIHADIAGLRTRLDEVAGPPTVAAAGDRAQAPEFHTLSAPSVDAESSREAQKKWWSRR